MATSSEISLRGDLDPKLSLIERDFRLGRRPRKAVLLYCVEAGALESRPLFLLLFIQAAGKG